MNIEAQTLSIVTGGTACNARCPFCVSRMTGNMDVKNEKRPQVNWRNFGKACHLAKASGATTAMLTGKGEPLLWTDLIDEYLHVMANDLNNPFPIIELQTNGILLRTARRADLRLLQDQTLKSWYNLGLTTIGISVVHWEPEKNKEIYTPGRSYIDLPALIKKLHDIGFTVRLCCVMVGGYVDDFESVKGMIKFARENQVEHLTFTPVATPGLSEDKEAMEWTSKRLVDPFRRVEPIIQGLEMEGAIENMRLPHGARVFDYLGQNVCFNSCLDPNPTDLENMRNIIFFPDGRVRHKWDSEASIIF